MIDRDSTLSLVKTLSALLSPFHDETVEPNGVITTADINGMTVSYKGRNIYCSYDSLIELPLIKTMSEYNGMPIPTYVSSYRSQSRGKTFISEIIEIQSIKELLDKLKEYVSGGNFINAARYFSVIQEVLSPYIKGDTIPFCIKIRTALAPARLHTPDCVGIKINFSQQSFQVTHPKSQVAFHHIENNVQKLLSKELNNEAIQMLIDGLCNEEITVKRKSDLYKILVETYCKLELFDDAIKVNKQWINHCIAHNLSSDKRLARMYTLLAKLEATVAGYEEDALENLKKSMQYDPDSEFYSKLYDTFIETFASRK
jgi:tetratricopeptide (TPR) repeat protein